MSESQRSTNWRTAHFVPANCFAVARWFKCADQGSARLVGAGRGNFAFNLFAVSSSDYERLRQLQREYFAQLRDIVSKSNPAERVAVVNMQLFALDDRDG